MQSNQKKPKINSMKAYKKAFPVPPLFMVAQLPFNNEETVKLNSPMIPIMDDIGNTKVCEMNLKQMGVWKPLLIREMRCYCRFMLKSTSLVLLTLLTRRTQSLTDMSRQWNKAS